MARDQVELSVETAWEELTNADADVVTFQAIAGDIFIRVTTNDTAPAAGLTGRKYQSGTGESNASVADLALSLGATGNRIWAKAASGSAATVYIDHADA